MAFTWFKRLFRAQVLGALQKGHLKVVVDPKKYKLIEYKITGSWSTEELQNAAYQTFFQLSERSRPYRLERLESIKQGARESASFTDVLFKRRQKWVEQAEMNLPSEEFRGQAARGSVQVWVNGNMDFLRCSVDDMDPEAVLPLVRHALIAAENQCEDRWRQVMLEGMDTDYMLEGHVEDPSAAINEVSA